VVLVVGLAYVNSRLREMLPVLFAYKKLLLREFVLVAALSDIFIS